MTTLEVIINEELRAILISCEVPKSLIGHVVKVGLTTVLLGETIPIDVKVKGRNSFFNRNKERGGGSCGRSGKVRLLCPHRSGIAGRPGGPSGIR